MNSRCIADTGRSSRNVYHVANRRTDSHPPAVGYQLVVTVHKFHPYPPPINEADDHVDISLEWSTAAGRLPPVHPADRSLRITLRLTLSEARRLAAELSRII